VLGQLPTWLAEPVDAVMVDLQGAAPIHALKAVATLVDTELNAVGLAVIEPGTLTGQLQPLPDAERLVSEPAEIPGGGNLVPRGLDGSALLAWVAELLQEDLAETQIAWGQSRPPCPYHPHPARPVVRDGEAWWICERLSEPLYRIGRGEVPTNSRPTPNRDPETRRARKRRHRNRP
jgi:hypothetical protein